MSTDTSKFNVGDEVTAVLRVTGTVFSKGLDGVVLRDHGSHYSEVIVWEDGRAGVDSNTTLELLSIDKVVPPLPDATGTIVRRSVPGAFFRYVRTYNFWVLLDEQPAYAGKLTFKQMDRLNNEGKVTVE